MYHNFIIYSCAGGHWGSVPLLNYILASDLIKKDFLFLFWLEIDYEDMIHALKVDHLKNILKLCNYYPGEF